MTTPTIHKDEISQPKHTPGLGPARTPPQTEGTDMTKYEAIKAFAAADDAWSQELGRLFGKKAGDIRYTKQSEGAEDSELRRLYDARQAAKADWDRVTDAERIHA